MASFGEQFSASRQTNQAVRALEATSRAKVAQVVKDWEIGIHTDQSVRWALEATVREAYRSSAAVGLAHLAAQAGVPRWKPTRMRADGLRSSYLDGLLSDVRRNLREYKGSARDSTARTKAVSRISHSAGVAAARGHTDALLRGALELSEDYGFIVRKVWRANYINHTPCELCDDLNGTEVPLKEGFPGDNRLLVYGDLKGPPRHPRCMCWLVILIVGLENLDDSIVDDAPSPEKETVTTDEVKAMKPFVFSKITTWFRKLIGKLRSERV